MPVTVGLLSVLTAAFLRRAGAVRERRITPNQMIWIPAHRCLSTCCFLEVYEGVVAGDVVVGVVLVMGGKRGHLTMGNTRDGHKA